MRNFWKFALWWVMCCVANAAAIDPPTDEMRLDAYNIAITPPAGWKQEINPSKNQTQVARFIGPDMGAIILVFVDKQYPPNGVDGKYIDDFERGTAKRGGPPRVYGKVVKVEGVRAYERLGRTKNAAGELTVLNRAIVVEGAVVNLQAMRVNGDASRDPEIQKSLASFRFLKPVKEPRFHLETRAGAFRFGFMVGRLTSIVMAGVILIWVLMKSIQRRKLDEARDVPPPIPQLPPTAHRS